MMTMTTEMPLAWLPLADAVIKATIVLACGAAASFFLRRASAALRHLVWTLALCSALALPVLTFALPKWQLPILTVASHQPQADSRVDDVSIERAAPERGRHGAAAAPAVMPEQAAADSAVPSSPGRLSMWLSSVTWQQALIGIWLLGAGAILLRVIVGLVAVRWMSRRTQQVTDAPWLKMACGIASDLGLRSELRFLRSGRASMPVATGIFRPSVIMPADADSWPESRLRIVLLHELAHVKRRDCVTHLLAQSACAFYWFNPLAWVAARRLRTERERACDDLVLASGTRGSDYADQLLEIARAMQGDRFPGLLAGASLAMAHRSQLEGRLIAILDPKVPRVGVSRASAAAAVVLCACAVAPLGALQPWKADAVQVSTVSLPTVNAEGAVVKGSLPTDTAPIATVQPSNLSPETKRSGVDARSDTRGPAAVNMAQETPQTHADEAHDAEATARAIADAMTSVDVSTAISDGIAATMQTPTPTPTPTPNPSPSPSPTPTPSPREKSDKAGSGPPDPRMVAALTAALKDTDKEVRETAMHALVQMRDPSIYEPLVQALKDASPDVREQAAFGLGQMRDRRAVQPLIGALKDENAGVREQAAFALGQLRDPAAVEALGAVLRDANGDVREQVVFALGQIRDRRAVDPLIVALKDTKPDVRQQAAFALGQLRDRAAVEALIIAIKDTNADVREQIAFALGQIRDPRAIDALTTLLKDQVADVRQQAAFALGQLAR
jgi:HEAT repeat protein/beta-lactamase regulating signal transducer with metallopeptidase domain